MPEIIFNISSRICIMKWEELEEFLRAIHMLIRKKENGQQTKEFHWHFHISRSLRLKIYFFTFFHLIIFKLIFSIRLRSLDWLNLFEKLLNFSSNLIHSVRPTSSLYFIISGDGETWRVMGLDINLKIIPIISIFCRSEVDGRGFYGFCFKLRETCDTIKNHPKKSFWENIFWLLQSHSSLSPPP
jgi:hypothetical protein